MPEILVIVNRLYEWSQNFITRELTELNRQGAEILIAARHIVDRNDLTEEERKLHSKTFLLPENPFLPQYWFPHLRCIWLFPTGYFQAWRILFSLDHRHLKKFLRSLVCLFRAAATSERVAREGIRLIHAHFLTAPGDTALFLSKMTGIPYGGTAHAMDIYTDNSGLKGKIRHAAYLCTCTGANFAYLSQLPGIHKEKIKLLYHGIEESEVVHDVPKPDVFTFIAVGRMVEKKGFHILLRACEILKKKGKTFHLILIGEGPMEQALKAQTVQSGLTEYVTFRGKIPPNEMSAQYQQAHLLVMPSIVDRSGDRDGLPNVCLEAMRARLPIIGSAVAGIPEGVKHGYNGWLVPPGDPMELASAMEMALSIADWQPFQRSAKEMVREHFSLKNNISALRKLMESHFN